MRIVLLGLLLALTGCRDEVADAEREAQIIENTQSDDLDAICAAKRKVAAAHLRAHDEKGYDLAKLTADISCTRAEQKRRLGS